MTLYADANKDLIILFARIDGSGSARAFVDVCGRIITPLDIKLSSPQNPRASQRTIEQMNDGSADRSADRLASASQGESLGGGRNP